MSPVWISVALHTALLGGGWFLFAGTDAGEPQPLAFAHVEILEPRAEDSTTPEEAVEKPCDAVDCAEDPLDSFEPVEAQLEDLVLPDDLDVPLSEPVDAHDLPLEVVKIRARPRPQTVSQPAPAPVTRARPVSPPVVRPPARKARGKPLRVISRPNVRHYYPAEAQRRGIEGTAYVEIRVDRRGVVIHAKVVRSSGYEILDRQALKVMYDHRFAAGDGGRARVPVSFSLR